MRFSVRSACERITYIIGVTVSVRTTSTVTQHAMATVNDIMNV